MSEEILINITPPETRVAVIENGVVQELIIERSRERGLVGNIYKVDFKYWIMHIFAKNERGFK